MIKRNKNDHERTNDDNDDVWTLYLDFLRKLHRDVSRVLRHLPWFLAGFEVKSVILSRRASAIPVRIESIWEEISEYHVIGVVPIKPNFIVLTCKLIVTALTADATPLRGLRWRVHEAVLVRSPKPSLRKQLRWILIDVKHVSRFTW